MNIEPNDYLDEDKELPGNYPPKEDIYNQFQKESELDPEDPTRYKEAFDDEDLTVDELDVPGSELDDEQEAIGSEDEENNYYSLGGDNHANLEEFQGD
jgi:hypothetical protein